MKRVSVVVVYGGELAKDVAEQIEALKPEFVGNSNIDVDVTLRCASERPKTLLHPLKVTTAAAAAVTNDNDINNDTTAPVAAVVVVVCFVLQTIENGSPTDEGGTTLRFFKRKTHPNDLLLLSSDSSSDTANDNIAGSGMALSWNYAVLGLGDSNLLLDRQTTTAVDCNQAAQQLDTRLHSLGGNRVCPIGLADERTGLQDEVEPWIRDVFWKSIIDQNGE